MEWRRGKGGMYELLQKAGGLINKNDWQEASTVVYPASNAVSSGLS